jgi:tyrosine-protein phosphatase YwqE
LFFFSKNRAILKDLIPSDYVDIHSHLLPGIDDGARTFEDTLGLVQALQGFGVSQFVTTPHTMHNVWDSTKEGILALKDQTVLELKNNGVIVPFRAASEYLMDDEFVRLFQTDELLTLKDNYVLVEMSYMNAPMQLYIILFDLQVAGYIPVLAHPERYAFYHKNFDEYAKLKRVGCRFQLNLLAVVGYYGETVAKVAEQLLQKGMYDFVGSDVHHSKHIAFFEEKVKLKDITALKETIANNRFFRVE